MDARIFVEKDSKYLKDPGKHMTVSKMHSFMKPVFAEPWTTTIQKANKWLSNTIITPALLIPAPLIQTFPQYPLSERCEELLPSKTRKGIRDMRMFLV